MFFADSGIDCNIFFIVICDCGFFWIVIPYVTFVPCFDYWYSFFVFCDTLTEVFPCFFPQLLGKCQGITHKRRDTALTYKLLYHII